jgi:hypothetical protein
MVRSADGMAGPCSDHDNRRSIAEVLVEHLEASEDKTSPERPLSDRVRGAITMLAENTDDQSSA